MATDGEDRYRTKYLDLLDDLDAKEKQWAEMDQRLRRILAHLLIVSEGPATPEISADLREIRESLKGGLDFPTLEERIEVLKERVLRETRWFDASPDFPPVHQILIHLVERLPLPPDMAPGAVEVIESLEPGIPPDGLPDAIDAVTGLVYLIRARMQEERRELEALLLEVTDGLQTLAQGLTDTHDQANAGFASSRSLEAAVNDEVRGLESRTREADDFEALRAAVQTTIGAIRQHLEAKKRDDESREAKIRGEMERLRRNIDELETEVTEYREKTRQARELSLRDPLTGCYNRLAYQERAQIETDRWQRYGSPLSLILFDLDHFKSINDNFGHKAGDQVLKAVARIAGDQLRRVDFFARYGGEEFLVLLPETTLDAAQTVAEKLRRAVESFRFHSRGSRVPVTLSSGAAQLADGDTIERAFARADKAMYFAKHEGRNRCATERDVASG